MRAGATRAVNPQLIGGRRMASFALHADVAEFLDGVMQANEITISSSRSAFPDQSVRGQEKALGDREFFRDMSVPVLAVRGPNKQAYLSQPSPLDRHKRLAAR